MSRDRQRILIAIFVGFIAGAVRLYVGLSGHFTFSDFDQSLVAARAALAGQDPYLAVTAYVSDWRFFYPMTAAIIALPFSLVPIQFGAAAWTAVGFGFLAYGLSARGWWPLLMLGTYPAFHAMISAQWTPILTAAAVVPALSFVALGKPTTGISIALAYLPKTLSWPSVVAGAIVVALAFVLAPRWVPAWLSAVRGANEYVLLARRPLGFLLPLALIRWRRPEARWLAFASLIPIAARGYEALPLVLIPRTKNEVWIFAALSCVAMYGLGTVPMGSQSDMTALSARWLIPSLYLPMLIMVLLRPNQSEADREHES